MLIEIHAIQNHSPSNLNRDDLGAPKTCFFGGVLRTRISSQCLKRSIRMSDEFKLLCGGIRTRRLPELISKKVFESTGRDVLGLSEAVVNACGLYAKKDSNGGPETVDGSKKDVIVFLSRTAVEKMVHLLADEPTEITAKRVATLATEFATLISRERYAPDMALSGRMLEPAKPLKPKGEKKPMKDKTGEGEGGDVWKNLETKIEAALQVAHAFSTHEARPEVDYFVAADDEPGNDAGGAHLGEAMFASACFYKYYSIYWEQLLNNLEGFAGKGEHLAAHTVGAFIRGAARCNPTGKQNSSAAHNMPDGLLVEIRRPGRSPVSYANAFAQPVPLNGPRDLISQSVAQLGQYVRDIEVGYGGPSARFWFSPNLRHPLTYREGDKEIGCVSDAGQCRSLSDLVSGVVREVGYDWGQVRQATVL